MNPPPGLPVIGGPLTDKAFLEKEIDEWLASDERRRQLEGETYYDGDQDILHRERMVIDEAGRLHKVDHLPNNRLLDNQYAKMVDQKTNYLLGQPLVLRTGDEQYTQALKKIFDKRFLRLLKNLGRDCLNGGIGWLFPYYNELGELCFRKLKPYEVIPGWKDEEHTRLEYAIRVFDVTVFEGRREKIVQKIEVFDLGGIHRFIYDDGKLLPDDAPDEPYFTFNGEGYNWDRVPLIPFKRGGDEMPLLKCVKSLQDGMNTILSTFQNNMEEDPRNTIMVLVNYEGTELAEFRRNLATYGVVKVATVDGAAGDVRTLSVQVNAANYQAILELFKKAIIENAMGYDAKDDRLSGNPNQMNIQSMYSDIDLDANDMETEWQAAFEDLLWFVNQHLANSGVGDFEGEDIEVIFNRDMLISESDIIGNIKSSVGILSRRTLIAQHPWVDDPEEELRRVEEEAQLTMNNEQCTMNRTDKQVAQTQATSAQPNAQAQQQPQANGTQSAPPPAA